MKSFTDQRVLVCGYSQAGYPRDETFLAVLRQFSFKLFFDLRVVDHRWIKYGILQKSDKSKSLILEYRLKWMRFLIKTLIQIRQVDFIFIMKWNEDLALDVIRWARGRDIKIIYDLWVSRYLQAKRDETNQNKWFELEKTIIEQANYVLAITPQYRQFYMQTYGVSEEKISVVPHVLETSWFGPRKPDAAEEKKSLIVCYWGQAHKHHGLAVAFEAAKYLKDIPVEFHFYGPLKLKERVDTAIQSLSLSNIYYKGFMLDTKTLIQAVDKADICLGHLVAEHDAHLVLPNKAIQGMARGKVVIHIENSDLKYFYQDSDQAITPLWFFVGTGRRLADDIQTLYNKPALREQIGMKARQCVFERHSLHNMQTALENVMQNMMNEKVLCE